MLNRSIIFITVTLGICLVLYYFGYRSGYNKHLNEYNARLIEINEDYNNEKKKLSDELLKKNIIIKNSKDDCLDRSLPDDIKQLFKK